MLKVFFFLHLHSIRRMARKMSYKEFTTRLLDDIKVQRFNNKYNVKKLFDHVKIINQIQSHIVSCSI